MNPLVDPSFPSHPAMMPTVSPTRVRQPREVVINEVDPLGILYKLEDDDAKPMKYMTTPEKRNVLIPFLQ
jgi:hypothetical protein